MYDMDKALFENGKLLFHCYDDWCFKNGKSAEIRVTKYSDFLEWTAVRIEIKVNDEWFTIRDYDAETGELLDTKEDVASVLAPMFYASLSQKA